MSEPDEDANPDSAAMRALLRRAVSPSVDAPSKSAAEAPPRDLLRNVQRKIRKRSKGRFFANGWSTSASRINYGLVAVIMLVLVGVTYLVLGPMGFSSP